MKQQTRELWRKVAHVLVGTGCLVGAYLLQQSYGAEMLDLMLAGVLVALVFCDILIADYGWRLPFYHHWQRPHEEQGLHTATLAFLGSVIAYKLFALPVALAAIAMLVYGDAAAALVGMLTGAGRRKRTLPRVGAMLITSALIGWLVLGWIGIAMAFVATLAECLVIRIDDALTIPLLAGLAGQLLMFFL